VLLNIEFQHLALGTQHSALGTRHSALSTWHSELGAWDSTSNICYSHREHFNTGKFVHQYYSDNLASVECRVLNIEFRTSALGTRHLVLGTWDSVLQTFATCTGNISTHKFVHQYYSDNLVSVECRVLNIEFRPSALGTRYSISGTRHSVLNV
jgi:hypothetical protein